jgi:hypothetical protein
MCIAGVVCGCKILKHQQAEICEEELPYFTAAAEQVWQSVLTEL